MFVTLFLVVGNSVAQFGISVFHFANSAFYYGKSVSHLDNFVFYLGTSISHFGSAGSYLVTVSHFDICISFSYCISLWLFWFSLFFESYLRHFQNFYMKGLPFSKNEETCTKIVSPLGKCFMCPSITTKFLLFAADAGGVGWIRTWTCREMAGESSLDQVWRELGTWLESLE